MTQAGDIREDPLNLGGGASSAPSRTWSPCHRRRRGAPIHKWQHHYGPKAQYEPSWKQLKQQRGPGPWFQPPPSPYWAMYSDWGCWGGPWCPPPMGYQKPPSPVQMPRMYALQPVCLCCCCACWRGPWHPGWARPPGRKKRWGHRGRGLRRHARRPGAKSPPEDVRTLLRPVNLYRWRTPGLRAPRNTTQFIMNQVYEDMRQQEEQEREQAAQRAQQAPAGGDDGSGAPPSEAEGKAELHDSLYGFVQNLSLALSPELENLFPAPQQAEEEEEETNDECDGECEECEECNGKEEESEKENEEAESQYEEEVEEADSVQEEEEEEEEENEEAAEKIEEEGERLEEDQQREEENYLPLEMPLSFLVEAEEERENFLNSF
ncbi:coiled-coil domain-containing glutamate-rich protein 1 [Saccopteryx bilineata]|uniref:coiled-coil domain-containing glutamate-rich protein 1 n=1 Tax=Saccopteryx bilineata TaxID=59482 RepID=UPI00338F31FD